MSFKRDGDDGSQLNILKKRRVADLLSNYIPEDEAGLLNNGRYTCLVCSYRPVFDTVDMLTVHRNGKKHLEGLRAFYGKKARLKTEIAKRQHELYIQAEDEGQEPSSSSSSSSSTTSSAPLLAQTRKLTRHALLKTATYDSRHRTTSTKGPKGGASGHGSSHKTPPDRREVQGVWAGSRGDGSWSAGPERTCPEESIPSEPQTRPDSPPPESQPPMSEQRRREMEHYLKLKSAGWLQDGRGGWVKDESVEFDSDEDEPPSLAPPND